MIINHEIEKYKEKRKASIGGRYNGAYYYSREICKNIIPQIDTDRNWITVNVEGAGCDHAIVFIHNNLHPEHYNWLSKYNDLILVCGIKETMQKVKHLGKVIHLPLSVDVEYIKKFKTTKTKGTAFAGRKAKRKGIDLKDADFLENLPRHELLRQMAQYKKVYAVGRTAIEAKVLGCQVLSYDPRFPDTRRWKVIDNNEAVAILQRKLDKIDRR